MASSKVYSNITFGLQTNNGSVSVKDGLFGADASLLLTATERVYSLDIKNSIPRSYQEFPDRDRELLRYDLQTAITIKFSLSPSGVLRWTQPKLSINVAVL